MNQHILKYEYENRTNYVIHVIVDKHWVDDYNDVIPGAFFRFLRDSMCEVLGLETYCLPVQVGNLEMDNEGTKAHWHIILYTHTDAQETISKFMETKIKCAGYLATALKRKIGFRFGINESESRKVQGVSIIKPEVKKFSAIDYAIKAGVKNFTIMGLYVDEAITFDIWENKARSDFYRKNCSGESAEGGVRAIYPGRKGPLSKRSVKDEFDPEAVSNYFIEKGHIPTDSDFRLYMYKEAGSTTFNKQHCELVKDLVRESLPVDMLPNPREKILKALSEYELLWGQLVDQLRDNFLVKNDAAKYQHSYLSNAVKVLGSDYCQGIYKWVGSYLVVDQEDRETQKNKALIIEGGSNSGKTALMEILFPDKVFGARGLTLDMKYATEGMYRSCCSLWIYRDINRGLSTENMFRFQNIIDGDETLREICKAEMQNMYLPRPIIAATTTDLVKSFEQRTASRADLVDRVEQIVNRLTIVRVPSPSKALINGEFKHTSDLLKFLIYPEILKLPNWTPFYLFWRHYFNHESTYREGINFCIEDYEDFLSVVSFDDISNGVKSLIGDTSIIEEDIANDSVRVDTIGAGGLSVCGLSHK